MLFAAPAAAFPDGAPWDAAAVRSDGEACERCHFDGKPVADSPALRLEGVSAPIVSGKVYSLRLTLDAPQAATGGFLALARAAEAEPVQEQGVFIAVSEDVETNGAMARSTVAAAAMSWRIDWRAPADDPGPVAFDIVANAANGDDSPFGDVIHLATFVVAAGGGPE